MKSIKQQLLDGLEAVRNNPEPFDMGNSHEDFVAYVVFGKPRYENIQEVWTWLCNLDNPSLVAELQLDILDAAESTEGANDELRYWDKIAGWFEQLEKNVHRVIKKYELE